MNHKFGAEVCPDADEPWSLSPFDDATYSRQPLRMRKPRKEPCCAKCHVIITCCSTLWILMTAITTAAILLSLVSADWLGVSHVVPSNRTVLNTSNTDSFTVNSSEPKVADYSSARVSSLGVYRRCVATLPTITPTAIPSSEASQLYYVICDDVISGLLTIMSSDCSILWKVMFVVMVTALGLMTLSLVAALVSMCCQTIGKKSIFTVIGLVQSFTALLLVAGLLLHLFGWRSSTVQELCGHKSGLFALGDCHLGFGLYMCIAAICIVFATALMSLRADKATSKGKVERRLENGECCICVF